MVRPLLPEREFVPTNAVRSEVPNLFGVFGASGAGKTESGHRVAQGMREVYGGELFVIDTEAGRARVLADRFKFKHVLFEPPFGSLDFLKSIQDSVKRGARVIQIDSMSMEHTGIGGFLERHDASADQLAALWRSTPEKTSMAAWNVVKTERRMLINEMVQLGTKVAFVLCFRAGEKTKPGTGGDILKLGFMPETDRNGAFIYELTASALLLPRAEGMPTWAPENQGERLMTKLPEFFKPIFAQPHRLCEEDGRKMAEWARGKSSIEVLTERAARVEEQIDGATELDPLLNVWRRAAKLVTALKDEAPELHDKLTLKYDGKRSDLEEAKKQKSE